MKITSMKIGTIAVGMIVVGAGLSLLAFLGGAKTNISLIDGEVVLSHPFDTVAVQVENAKYGNRNEVKKVSDAGYITIQETIESVSKLDIEVDTLDVDIVAGEEYAIDIRYKDTEDVFYEVRDGKLTIKQEDHMEWTMFGREGKKGEAIIYLPKEAFIEKLELDMGLGSNKIADIQVDKLELDCGMGSIDINNLVINKGYIEGGMGEIRATDIKSNGLNVSMGMGSIDLRGDLKGITDIEGGMGELSLTTLGKETDYDYDLSKGMGEISINGRRNNSFEDLRENNGADNKIIIEGGMGSITVNTED